jgi:hypothetical protein
MPCVAVVEFIERNKRIIPALVSCVVVHKTKLGRISSWLVVQKNHRPLRLRDGQGPCGTKRDTTAASGKKFGWSQELNLPTDVLGCTGSTVVVEADKD